MDNLYSDQITYSEYMDDLNYSQGFYVTPPGIVLPGSIRRVGDQSDDRYRKAESAATFAVEEYNRKGKGLLKFLRIVNLNVEPTAGTIYYITMAAADASGETIHYQVKVWGKIKSGYQVQIFRPAPYWIKSSDKLGSDTYCVGIFNLEPWMDESYIYYKCFFKAPKELLGVEVIYDEEEEETIGFLWFTSCEDSMRILKEYEGKRMPKSNTFYDFDIPIF